MALLGVILLLAGIGAGVYAYVGTHAETATTTVTALGFSREATPLELVGFGALAVLLFAIGWALLSASARRRARARRVAREDSRVGELEERSESDRLEHERRFEEAGLRDEDLRRREAELAARHEGLNQREAELDRRDSGSDSHGLDRPGDPDSPDSPDRPGDPDSPDRPGDPGSPSSRDGRGGLDGRPDRDVTGDDGLQSARPPETRDRPYDAPHQTV